jgi:NAD(P)H-quinone oxidoreductase subunit K
LQTGTHTVPPKELMEAMGMPLSDTVAELTPENKEV